MDKTIDIYVNGSYIKKNNNTAGVQGEGNATTLHIIFDNSWADMAKSITYWDSRGENPVKITLTNELLVDLTVSLLEYNAKIPAEPMAYEGKLTFVIDGYVSGVRQRSVQDTLYVKPALQVANQPVDPTPTQAEQLQSAIEAILPDVQAETIKAETAASSAATSANNAETSAAEAASSAQQAASSAASIFDSVASAAASADRAENARKAVETAQTAAETAQTAAETAKTQAETARAEAETAQNAAITAKNDAETAKAGAETAQTKAETAQSMAEAAQTAAETARSGAETAHTLAKASANAAKESANTAEAKATEATNQALLSKSYAVGGTGTRSGEDSDNAKYYCEQAKSIVGGDYVTNTQLNTFKTENVDPIAEDVSELRDTVNNNTSAISTLNSTGAGSVKKQIDDAFNEFATNISNDGVVNTYKELVDYCATHSAEAAEMAGNIAENATAISELQTKSAQLETAIAAAGIMTDDTTGKKYKLGITNGALYYKEVSE